MSPTTIPDIASPDTPSAAPAQPDPITINAPLAMASPSKIPRRSTISGFRPLPSPPTPPSLPLPVSVKPGTCTHLSLTRLYTNEFPCMLCGRFGSMGWVYRCIQDREHLLEHDLQHSTHDRMDALCDILETSNVPKKRSTAARESPLSLLDEITEEQWTTYTPAQVGVLLRQRSNLQRVLATTNILHAQALNEQSAAAQNQPPPDPFSSTSNSSPSFPSTPFQFPTPASPIKPWVPLKECQFKCCAACRPSFREKSYLGLDAIMNGDVPATVSQGFGFHLHGSRPVVHVDLVRNIGLRPNPAIRENFVPYSPSSSSTQSSSPSISLSIATPSPKTLRHRTATENLKCTTPGLGLGILDPEKDDSFPLKATQPFSSIDSLIFNADDAAAAAAASFVPVTSHSNDDSEGKRRDEDGHLTLKGKGKEPEPFNHSIKHHPNISNDKQENSYPSGTAICDFAFPSPSETPSSKGRPSSSIPFPPRPSTTSTSTPNQNINNQLHRFRTRFRIRSTRAKSVSASVSSESTTSSASTAFQDRDGYPPSRIQIRSSKIDSVVTGEGCGNSVGEVSISLDDGRVVKDSASEAAGEEVGNENEIEDSEGTMIISSCSQPDGEENVREGGKESIEVGGASVSVGGVIVSDKDPTKKGGSQ